MGKNADWDEYLLKISNQSKQPIQVTELVVVDSLNTRVESLPDRKQLVKKSKETARRYKNLGIRVEAGSGNTKILAVAGATAGGAAIGAMAAGGGAILGPGVAAATAGVLVLAPALAIGGIIRGVNHSAVNKQIEQRQTLLPIDVPAGDELMLDVFFPLAPSPRRVELAYSDATGQHIIVIDTSAALNGLHIESED